MMWTIAFLLLLAITLVTVYYKLIVIRIEGDSMSPTYHHGQYALVVRKGSRLKKPRKKGDVVLLYSPQGTPVIKRLETSEVHKGRTHYYVSRDSRHYGHVSEDAIIGRVFPNRDKFN